MQTRVVAIGVGIVAVATGGIIGVTVTSSSGGTTAAKPPAPSVTPSVLGYSTSQPPTSASASTTPIAPAPSATPSTPPASASPTTISTATAKTGTITYVVKPGDNLSVISAWFHLHGYGALYDANRSVIGDNPNLIFPGERITISDGTMTTSAP